MFEAFVHHAPPKPRKQPRQELRAPKMALPAHVPVPGLDISYSGTTLTEIKLCPLDLELAQEALCRRFHWLAARQILFRRKEIR
jgi:hypothetical protein